jgi:hypothetical protein
MLLPRIEGLPQPAGIDQHLRQDGAQGKLSPIIETCCWIANPRQPVLDILAEMIAVDTSIPVGGSKTPSEAGSAGDLE